MIKNKKRLMINIAAIFLIAFGIRLYIDNNVFEVTYIRFEDSEIPQAFDGTKILHISDLHNKSYGNNNEGLLAKIKELSPNYIFLTGDMVSSRDTDFTNFFHFAYELGKRYDCYYILGNHEMDLSNEDRKKIYETLESYHITVLDNEMVQLEKNGEIINLYGMWYNPKYYIKEEFSLENMQKILGNSLLNYI